MLLTNERPGIWSCDLWANERPQNKLHLMAQTNRHTDGHGGSMTDLAQRAESVKIMSKVMCIIEENKYTIRSYPRLSSPALIALSEIN